VAETGLVLTGARCRLSLNNVKVGYATGCDTSEQYQYEALRVLDNIEVEEHVPVSYDVAFSAARVRLVGKGLRAAGVMPKLGVSAEEHLRNVLTSGELTGTLEDSKSGKVIAMITGCKVSSRQLSVQAGGMAAENVQFVARRIADESEA